MKYHYLYCCFTYSIMRWSQSWDSSDKCLRDMLLVEDIVRWGVWLGRHICERIAQVS